MLAMRLRALCLSLGLMLGGLCGCVTLDRGDAGERRQH